MKSLSRQCRFDHSSLSQDDKWPLAITNMFYKKSLVVAVAFWLPCQTLWWVTNHSDRLFSSKSYISGKIMKLAACCRLLAYLISCRGHHGVVCLSIFVCVCVVRCPGLLSAVIFNWCVISEEQLDMSPLACTPAFFHLASLAKLVGIDTFSFSECVFTWGAQGFCVHLFPN